jgi:ABC-type transport system substrate-binding protein
MSQRSIKPRVLSGLATMSAMILALGVAACSSSGSSTASGSTSSSPSSAMGTKTLVVESTPLSPLTQTFNPFSATSTGYTLHSTNLYYEPLFFFNILNPSQAPVPMLATAYSFSNGGKTLTLTTRSGVKWSDGKPFSAADVAFTFNLIAKNPALAQTGTPAPTSATATGPNTVVLNFAQPQAGPVGTGPYVLDKFTPQGILFKANPGYWNKSAIHVPEVDFPSYVSNTAAEQALESGQIDWAGNYITNVQNVFVAKDPAHNKVWFNSNPYMTSNNVVTLWLNTTRAPLNDPKVRQAISYAADRQQLADQGETGYELPATSSSGLLLPVDQSLLQSQYANDLPATSDASKVASILTSDGYTKVNGKWSKNGKTISFSVEDPISFSDFWLDVQLLTAQLNKLGFDVKADGIGNATNWFTDQATGNFDAMIRWSNNGPTPYYYYYNWMDSGTSAPLGKTAANNFGRFNDPQAQSALTQYVSSTNQSTQQSALNTLQGIMSAQMPVIPLLYGASWAEFSTRNYTGWPSQANPYTDPGPNPTQIEYVILHLKPAS